MTVKAIWAEDLNGIIGDGHTLLWDIPEDLQHFKKTTLGNDVLMGSRTWDSLPKKPLPARLNIVASSKLDVLEGAEVTHDLNATLQQRFQTEETLWVIGGGVVYSNALPYCEEIHITRVDISVETNTPVYAPVYTDQFVLVEMSEKLESKSGLSFHYEIWKRTNA